MKAVKSAVKSSMVRTANSCCTSGSAGSRPAASIFARQRGQTHGMGLTISKKNPSTTGTHSKMSSTCAFRKSR